MSYTLHAGIESASGSVSNCTVKYLNGTASVSCVDSTSRYQVILLQQNDPNNVVVVDVSAGSRVSVPGVFSGRYCVLELIMEDNEIEVKYSTEFIASTASRTTICK